MKDVAISAGGFGVDIQRIGTSKILWVGIPKGGAHKPVKYMPVHKADIGR
jgi:hypothetical protein